MKVIIDTTARTIQVIEPATLIELAKLEGILKAHYGGEDWKHIGEASDNNAPLPLQDFVYPVYRGHQCVPMPLYPVERGQPMPCAPNTGSPLITPPFVITCGQGVKAMATTL